MTGPLRYTGTPGTPGVALGRLRHTRRAAPATGPVAATAAEVTAAFDAVAAGLRELAARLRAQDRGGDPADIMEVSALIAEDPDLREAALQALARGSPGDEAVREAAAGYAGVLAALPDPVLAGRAADVRRIGHRVAERLRGEAADDTTPDSTAPDSTRGAVILVGAELGADDLLDTREPLAGAVSLLGGPNAHVAIVARALGVPLVFGVEPPDLPDGLDAIVDGARGTLTVSPTPAQRQAAEREAAAARARRESLRAARGLPPVTLDGERVALLANVSTEADAVAALAAGAEGAGLVRTELPFLAAGSWPSYEEHLAALGPVLAALRGRVATVRVLDFAPDKLPPFLAGARTARQGLELLLAEPGALAAQLRAIVDAGRNTTLRVMAPMVTSADQLRRCRELLTRAAGPGPVPPLGAMVELPEAVAAVDELAREAGFLSIGSNDLTAALLGLDRGDPALTPARSAEPVVLEAVAAVVAAGRRHGRTVSVCGDAAADPAVVPLLLRAGCRVLSVAPSALDEVRAAVRGSRTGVPGS